MQTTSSAMIDDLMAVIGKHTSNFVGFYDDINEITDSFPKPPDGLQAIAMHPSEFYYHAHDGAWQKFAPVGEVHPSYIGAYDTLQDLQVAKPSPSDGDVAIIGKQKFYIYASGSWDALISSASGTESAQVTKNAADIVSLKKTTADNQAQSNANKSRILQLNAILAVTRQAIQNLDPRPVFEYYGPNLPTLPDRPRSAYFINVYAMTKNEELTLPHFIDFDVRSGAIFFIANDDTNNSINIKSVSGKINGSDAINLPPGNILVLAKVDGGWQKLISGFMPPAIGNLINLIRSRLNDELHTKDEIDKTIDDWLANPTTKARLDTIMTQLGYEKANSGTSPHPSTIRVHYGTGDNYPTDFTGETGEALPHEDMVITGLNLAPKKVWVAVPTNSALKVAGISANHGLPARWEFTKINVGGRDWTVFISPTSLADERLTLEIQWRI